MSPRRWLALFYLLSSGCLLLLAAVGGLDANIFAVAMTAPATIWAAAKDELPRAAGDVPSADRIEHDFAWRPWVVVAVFVAYLQLVARSLAALVGAGAGEVLELVGVDDPALITELVVGVSWIVLLPMAVAVVPVTVWASHRLRRGALGWILVGVLADRLITVLVALAMLGIPLDVWPMAIALELVAGVLFLPGILLGLWWAKRTYREFVTSRLVNALPSKDQVAIVDMARESVLARLRGTPPAV